MEKSIQMGSKRKGNLSEQEKKRERYRQGGA